MEVKLSIYLNEPVFVMIKAIFMFLIDDVAIYEGNKLDVCGCYP